MSNRISADSIPSSAYYHHSAWASGYVSRKSEGYAEPYTGKYGRGWVAHYPAYGSTRYHRIDYFIESPT